MQRWPWLQAEAAKERERLRAELEKDKARNLWESRLTQRYLPAHYLSHLARGAASSLIDLNLRQQTLPHKGSIRRARRIRLPRSHTQSAFPLRPIPAYGPFLLMAHSCLWPIRA